LRFPFKLYIDGALFYAILVFYKKITSQKLKLNKKKKKLH